MFLFITYIHILHIYIYYIYNFYSFYVIFTIETLLLYLRAFYFIASFKTFLSFKNNVNMFSSVLVFP